MVSDPVRLTTTEVAALHAELAALIRAGVPLDRRLADLGRDLTGGVGRSLTRIGERLEAGESLAGVLKDPAIGIPETYRAVIEAGVRSGKLSVALEDVATAARRVAEARRIVGLAVIYPLAVALFAYLLLILVVLYFFPLLTQVIEGLLQRPTMSVVIMQWLSDYLVWWVAWPPLLVALLTWRLWRGDPSDENIGTRSFPQRWRRRWSRYTPAAVMRLSQLATLSDLLGLLIAHQVPLDQAVRLAAQATGWKSWMAAAEQIASCLQRGESPVDSFRAAPRFPAVAGWLACGSTGAIPEESLAARALRQAAESYRDQAAAALDRLAVYLPALYSGALGGAAVMAYAVVLFAPYYELLLRLGLSP